MTDNAGGTPRDRSQSRIDAERWIGAVACDGSMSGAAAQSIDWIISQLERELSEANRVCDMIAAERDAFQKARDDERVRAERAEKERDDSIVSRHYDPAHRCSLANKHLPHDFCDGQPRATEPKE